MAIPTPRRTDTGGDPFAAVLDRAVQDTPRERAVPEPAEARDAAPPADELPADQAAELPPETDAPAADANGDAADAAVGDGATSPFAQTQPDDTLSRGESARRETAGKGTDSPRTSSPHGASAEPLVAVVVQQGVQHNGPVVAGASPNAITAVGAASAAKGAGQALLRGFDAGDLRPNAPTRAAATTPGYRTQTVGGAELLEQARDSVFKQILLQLAPDGGEMRLRLQPPDLGELDLRLVVEQGNKLSLTVTAERADLAAMLQKHLDELKQTLQASGLEVTDAQVHTRGDGDRAAERGFAQHGRRHGADDTTDAAPEPPARRWVRAEGLDFWA